MKLSVVCLMLASILFPYVQSDGCECNFPADRYRGVFRHISYINIRGKSTKYVYDGNFNVDLKGYYFRAYLNHPTFGSMYYYKENDKQVVCYDDEDKYCDENQKDLFFVFPKCLPNGAKWGDSDLYYKDVNIGGTNYTVHYTVDEELDDNKKCPAYVFTWFDKSSSRGDVYEYRAEKRFSEFTVDQKRNLKFFRADITEKFPGLVNFDGNLG